MYLQKDYLNRLKKIEGLSFDPFSIKDKRIHYTNPYFKERLVEDVTQIDFNALYPSIQIALFNSGMIEEKWREDIQRVEWFLKNRKEIKSLSSEEYTKWKTHCNSLYLKIKSPYVVEYMNMFYSDLIDKYGDRIIYVDVDLLILNFNKSEIKKLDLISEIKDFEYDTTFINYFYIEDLKRYIKQDEFGEITTKGFKEPKRQKLESVIKTEIRKRKLEKLGI